MHCKQTDNLWSRVNWTEVSDTILGRGSLFAYRSNFRNDGGPFSWVRNTTGNHGDVFVECTFAAPDGKKADYGRTKSNHGTAYPDAEFVVINCKVKNIIPQGWSAIGEKSSRMYEFNTCDMETGKPVDVSQRHAYSRQLMRKRRSAHCGLHESGVCIERMATFQLFEKLINYTYYII